MKTYRNRAEVPEKYKWNLTEYFKDEEDFLKNYKRAEKLISELETYKNCTKDPKKLYEYLQKEIETFSLVQDLYVYAIVINDQEVGISSSIERKNKVTLLDTAFSKATSFFAPELLNLSTEEYQKLFERNRNLLEYKAQLDTIYREKGHILTKDLENMITEIINSMNYFSEMSSTILHKEHNYGTVTIDGREELITTSNYHFLLKNKDSKIRKQVYEQFNRKLDEYGDSCASFLNGYINMNQTIANLHHFENAWEKKLFEWNLSDKVFKALVSTTEKNLNVLQKYYKLKEKVLGHKLHPYDLNLEMVPSTSEYTIEEAQEIVKNSLEILGKDYIEKYNKIIKNHYIDYCQYKGKCSGGYNISTLNKNSLILMSFNGDLKSISTIAHECGHHIHKQYIQENNKIQYASMYIIVSEVVSLTNECLLSDYIAKTAKTKEEKLAGIENMISTIISNLFGAVREGKMEETMYQEVLNKKSLTKEYLDNLTLDSLKRYYGNYVEIDSYAKNSWITRSHYYMDFYLYSYAICISVATSVASKILAGDKKVLEKYIQLLQAGNDIWPADAFKILGINLEDKKVYEEAIHYLNSLLDKYEKIYNQEV